MLRSQSGNGIWRSRFGCEYCGSNTDILRVLPGFNMKMIRADIYLDVPSYHHRSAYTPMPIYLCLKLQLVSRHVLSLLPPRFQVPLLCSTILRLCRGSVVGSGKYCAELSIGNVRMLSVERVLGNDMGSKLPIDGGMCSPKRL